MPLVHVHPMSLAFEIFEELAHALTHEPKIAASRNTPEHLHDLYDRQLAVVLMEGGAPIGFIAAWPVEEGYYEIGSVWVHLGHRGRGHSHTIYEAMVELLALNGHLAFQITTNPLAVRSGQKVGLMVHEDWSTPVPRHLTCGPCEFVAAAQRDTCPHRNTTCWLQVLRHA